MLKLASIALLTGLLCIKALAFDGPAPPRSIPFTQGGKIYNAYVQTWHPHYAQSNICYYPTSYDPSLAPVLATDGIVQFGYLSITRLLLNPSSPAQSWDSVLFASDGLLCAMFWSGAWNDPLSTPTRIFYQQYGWNDWYFNDQYNYRLNLTTDLVRAVGIDVRSNFTYDYAGQFGLGQVTAGGVVLAGSAPASPALSFPLEGLTPETASINSVMDHSVPIDSNGPHFYSHDANGLVTAYTGELGLRNCGLRKCEDQFSPGHFGYKQSTGRKFYVNGSYSGGGAPNYLYYEGHPGFDYHAPMRTPILAPADGIAYIPSDDVISSESAPTRVISRFNVLAVDHQNGYVTWYLHMGNAASGEDYRRIECPAGAPEILLQPGQAIPVSRGCRIGFTGDKGVRGVPHLHFEVRRGVTTDLVTQLRACVRPTCFPVDPYGWTPLPNAPVQSDPYSTFPGGVRLWGQ